VELYLHSPWRGAQLKKHRDNLTFTFTLVAWLCQWYKISLQKSAVTEPVMKFHAFKVLNVQKNPPLNPALSELIKYLFLVFWHLTPLIIGRRIPTFRKNLLRSSAE